MSKIKLVYLDNYVAQFYRQDRAGRWRKFEFIGNCGVAAQIAEMLQRLGHTVEIVEEINEQN